jgi:uncharacterized protein YggE
MKHAIRLVAYFVLALVVATTATAQDANRRTISVSGTGSVRVKPDLALATLGTAKTAAKLPDAKSAADDSIAKVRAALKKAGIADQDIQTVQYQIYRVQANPQAGIRESSWKVVHMLQIRTKKPQAIANIVDAAVAAGATDVRGIEFTVDQLAEHRGKARELAVRAALDKARDLARLLGVEVGRVFSVTEIGDYQPMAQITTNVRWDNGFISGDSGIAGGQVEVATTAQVVFEIK